MIRRILSISCLILGDAGLQRVHENSVPSTSLRAGSPGLESSPPLFPALKRWAKLGRPSGAAFSIACTILVCAMATSVRAADAASGDVVLRALREEMERSKANLKLENVPAPYYIEYRVTEIDQFDASAVFGALRNQQHNHGRLFRVVVRVGDYKQDSFFGTGEGSIDAQTLQGKGPFAVAQGARDRQIPVIGLAGTIPSVPDVRLGEFFQVLLAIGNGPTDLQEAIRSTEAGLTRTAAAVGELLALG